MRKMLLSLILALALVCGVCYAEDTEYMNPDDFVGDYMNSEYYVSIMNMIAEDEDTNTALLYTVIAIRFDSDTEDTFWTMTGDFSPADSALVYADAIQEHDVYTDSFESVETTTVLENGTGAFTLDDNGNLVWTDDNDDAVTSLVLERQVFTGKTIIPDYTIIDLDNIPDGYYNASFSLGDIAVDENDGSIYFNVIDIYTPELYLAEDVASLEVGDTVIAGENLVEVTSIELDEDTGIYTVNATDDMPGVMLFPLEDGHYQVWVNGSSYTLLTWQGTTWLPLADTATFTCLGTEEDGMTTYEYADLLDGLANYDSDAYNQNAVLISVTDGQITEIILNIMA